jgi:hypothetical protein
MIRVAGEYFQVELQWWLPLRENEPPVPPKLRFDRIRASHNEEAATTAQQIAAEEYGGQPSHWTVKRVRRVDE